MGEQFGVRSSREANRRASHCTDRMVKAIFAGLVVLAAMVTSALGQSPSQSPDATASVAEAQTPAPVTRQAPSHPSRKVFRAARLTYLMGNVLIEQASSTTEDVAVVNMPVVEGSQVSTGEDGQAEIEFEDGSLVRLTPNSAITLPKMSVDGSGNYLTRIAVVGGLVYLELRAGTKYQYSVDAGGAVVSATENSTIRVSFDEPPPAIAVLDGAVHVSPVSGPAETVVDAVAGQTAAADPSSQAAPYLIKEEIAPESWDQWNEERDQVAAGEAALQTSARDQYAADQGYGWSDLDANGSWYNLPGQAPGQGPVWQPNQADDSGPGDSGEDASGADAGNGFDPYGYGSWVWTPAGYSWASAYSWGWLPYRCGQWNYYDGFGWGWQPAIACGVYGFGGYGFGGYGFGVNIGHAPTFWRHPKRPIPGPGPVHPLIHGRIGTAPIAVARSYGEGRVVRVKTVGGRNIDPLPPVANASALRGSSAVGSALKRDYPLSAGTHEASLGIPATHVAPVTAENGRTAWQSGYNSGQAPAGRSHLMPAWPNSGFQPSRSAPAPRPQSAPIPRPSAPPAASRPAPAASSSPRK